MNTADTIRNNWTIASQPALKIGVRSAGWYRITRDEMAAAGFNTAMDARTCACSSMRLRLLFALVGRVAS